MKNNQNSYIKGTAKQYNDPRPVYVKTIFDQIKEDHGESSRTLTEVLEDLRVTNSHDHDERYYTKSQIDEKIVVSSNDLDDGTSALETGKLYIVLAD